MKVAFTVWNDRISPVFDAAKTILVAEIKHFQVTNKIYEFFDPQAPASLVKRMTELQVDLFITGAITQTPASVIESSDITLIPFIGGRVNDALLLFAKGDSPVPKMLMPGARETIKYDHCQPYQPYQTKETNHARKRRNRTHGQRPDDRGRERRLPI